MRYFTSITLLCMSLVFMFSSCQKNLADVDSGIDSTVFAPKKIIVNDVRSPSPKLYYSLKYAADKSRIDVYFDDTTNSNPYDVLVTSYIFNNDGYLIKSLSQFLGSSNGESDTVFIIRSSDNKITSITESFKRSGVRLTKDTSIFNYTGVAGGTAITIARISANYDFLGGMSIVRDTNVYTYNVANVLQSVRKRSDTHSNSGTYTCSYNANGSLQTIHYADNNNGNVDASFSYNSGLPDGKEDYIPKLFLGKDYYLQDITNFPSDGSRYDEPNCCVISQTNPQHISKMHVVSNIPGIDPIRDYNFTYQQNKYLLPVSVLEGYNQNEFRY